MVMYYCGQFAKKIPYAASCKPVRMYLELKERFIHPCCMTFLKTYFYQFSREHDIGSHLQITRNCGYESDNRVFSMSLVAIV